MGVVAALVYAVMFYSSHVLPNVNIAGLGVGGNTKKEVMTKVQALEKRLKISFRDDVIKVTPALDEIGVTVDKEATVKNVLDARRGQNFTDDVQLWKTVDVPLELTINEGRLARYLQTTFPTTFRQAVAPTLRYNAEVEQFDMIPGKPGAGFTTDKIALSIVAAAHEPRPIMFRSTKRPVYHSVTDTTAVYTQDEANKRLLLRLDFLYEGKLIYFPEPSEIASWFEFKPNESSARLDIGYTKQKIVDFLNTRVTKSVNVYGPRLTVAEASEKFTIADTSMLAEDVIAALKANEPIEKEVEVVTVDPNPEVAAP